MGTAEGTGAGADRTWPARHGGGYPPGWQVRYRGRRARTDPGLAGPPAGQERIGTIARPTLRDEHTGVTWVAVRPFCAAPHTPLRLVRATDIIDARPPGEPAPATTVVDDEDRDPVVVVELPERGPG
ncbi:hypothetical protein [Amycolatopsis kentuckyensis]|uniref:hypothetical protein n=1 Tax=Amycolatopsis kentuckyensis TaxID=218823 RepID=UPI000A395AB2|nr:hypothetical protein [Amycolatopsis kentuckyensis]